MNKKPYFEPSHCQQLLATIATCSKKFDSHSSKDSICADKTDLTPEPMLLIYPCSTLHPVIRQYLITARRTFIKQVSSYLMKLKCS